MGPEIPRVKMGIAEDRARPRDVAAPPSRSRTHEGVGRSGSRLPRLAAASGNCVPVRVSAGGGQANKHGGTSGLSRNARFTEQARCVEAAVVAYLDCKVEKLNHSSRDQTRSARPAAIAA